MLAPAAESSENVEIYASNLIENHGSPDFPYRQTIKGDGGCGLNAGIVGMLMRSAVNPEEARAFAAKVRGFIEGKEGDFEAAKKAIISGRRKKIAEDEAQKEAIEGHIGRLEALTFEQFRELVGRVETARSYADIQPLIQKLDFVPLLARMVLPQERCLEIARSSAEEMKHLFGGEHADEANFLIEQINEAAQRIAIHSGDRIDGFNPENLRVGGNPIGERTIVIEENYQLESLQDYHRFLLSVYRDVEEQDYMPSTLPTDVVSDGLKQVIPNTVPIEIRDAESRNAPNPQAIHIVGGGAHFELVHHKDGVVCGRLRPVPASSVPAPASSRIPSPPSGPPQARAMSRPAAGGAGGGKVVDRAILEKMRGLFPVNGLDYTDANAAYRDMVKARGDADDFACHDDFCHDLFGIGSIIDEGEDLARVVRPLFAREIEDKYYDHSKKRWVNSEGSLIERKFMVGRKPMRADSVLNFVFKRVDEKIDSLSSFDSDVNLLPERLAVCDTSSNTAADVSSLFAEIVGRVRDKFLAAYPESKRDSIPPVFLKYALKCQFELIKKQLIDLSPNFRNLSSVADRPTRMVAPYNLAFHEAIEFPRLVFLKQRDAILSGGTLPNLSYPQNPNTPTQ